MPTPALKIKYPMTPAAIERAIILNMPYLTCEAANAEVVRLTLENIRLRYELEKKEAKV